MLWGMGASGPYVDAWAGNVNPDRAIGQPALDRPQDARGGIAQQLFRRRAVGHSGEGGKAKRAGGEGVL